MSGPIGALAAIAPGVGRGNAAGSRGPLTSVPGAAAGLYLPSRELAHAGHELTQMILRSKLSREHDPALARLLAAAASRHSPDFAPELVVSVPPTPGQDDRFRNIRTELARRTAACDVGAALSQTRAVPDYRRMTVAQRRAASDGRCTANHLVRGRSVLLIDDVVASGGQASDAIRALHAAGAADVRFVCLARSVGAPRGRAGEAPDPDLFALRASTVRPGWRSRTITP